MTNPYLLQQGGDLLRVLAASDHSPQFLRSQWQQSVALRAFFEDEAVFLAWHRNRHRAIHAGNDANIELLAGGLQGLGYRNVQGRYFLGYEEGGVEWVRRIAMRVPADQPAETFKWLGSVPAPKKFEGERDRASLTDYQITILSEKYELTVEADVDDLRRDKTGQILRQIGSMGSKMAGFDERLLSSMLESSAVCYDGLSLWNTAHKIGKSTSTQSNDITVSGLGTPDLPTTAGMVTAIMAGLKQVLGQLDDRGDPMNQNAKRFVLVTPLKYWDATLAALKNVFTSAGVSNTLLNSGVTVTPFTNVRLNGTATAAGRRIYLFREDAEVPPFLIQDEEIPDAFKSQDAYSEGGFWRDKIAWGAKRIVGIAPGRFELGCRVTLAV